MKSLKFHFITLLLLISINKSFGFTRDSLYTEIRNDTLFVFDMNEVNSEFSPVITYTIEDSIITIIEHDTSTNYTTGQWVKIFCTPIIGLNEGHYSIDIFYQYDFAYYVPDSLYFRGSIEVDFCKKSKFTVKEFYPIADSIAHNIDNSSILTLIVGDDVDTTGRSGGWKFGYKDFAVIARAHSFELDTTFEWLTGTAVINSDWIDSDSALFIAEKNGGSEFRKQYSDWSIHAELYSPSGNPFVTYWEILYFRKDFPIFKFFIEIDAETGGFERSFYLDVDENSIIVSTFRLFQNYPNPFNPSTTIHYIIIESCHVVIQIFDTQGREVKTYNEGIRIPGDYKLELFLKDLPTGVYFYQLQAGKFIKTKKFVKVM